MLTCSVSVYRASSKFIRAPFRRIDCGTNFSKFLKSAALARKQPL